MAGSKKRGTAVRRGGSAPKALREALDEMLARWDPGRPLPETIELNGETKPVRWLLGQLWNCTDNLPGAYCEMLEMNRGTYAQAARRILRRMNA